MTGRDGRAPREALNRERVLRAACAVADADGMDAVSMRRVAQELGVVPMALYKHVADKDDLVDGMVDLVIGEIGAGDASAGWKIAVRQRVLSARAAVLRHPWARRAVESRTRRTPVVLGYMDSLAGALRAGGLSVELTHHALHALGNRMWGFSPELFEEPPATDTPAPAPGQLDVATAEFARRYPHVVEIATAATGGDLSRVGGGCDEQFEFEFALDLLLDGVERLHLAGWSPRPR